MDAGVRGALWLHLAAETGRQSPTSDPNAIVPAEGFREAVRSLGEGAQRRLAHSYVALWARTFRTLVRHLRGRPETALALFVSEVYPFLRGERRAARIETQNRGHARLLMREDLPTAYLAGLAEAFVGLSGAHAHATGHGHEVFDLRFRVAPQDRLARLLGQFAEMRIPFLVSALLAALVGVMGATARDPLRVAAVLIGVVAVQAAANALHELRRRGHDGPFRAPRLPRFMPLGTVVLGYGTGIGAGIYLAYTGTPWVTAWAFVGLGLSLLYALFEDLGWGPLMAGITYGPLVATGALHALQGWGALDAYVAVGGASIGLGALAAAMVYVDGLADRPLDQAAGRRTLLVRLPRRSHVIGYALLVGTAAASILALAYTQIGWRALPAIGAAVIAAWLTRLVAAHVDDPHGLAPARVGTLAFHAAAGIILALVLGGT